MALGQGEKFEGQIKPSAIEVNGYEPDVFAQRTVEIASNQQMRADYVSRTDMQPVYLGYAPKGLSESKPEWLLHYYTYDTQGRVLSRTISYDSWTNHSTAVYS